MFMVHPTLSEENMYYIIEQMKEIMAHASIQH
jgi:ribosomal protein S6